MKKIISILLFIICVPLLGQNTIIKTSQIKLQFVEADEFIGKDALGYDYFIKNNTFFKIKDKETWQYKSVSLGKIMKVDIQNPLQIILFYGTFNIIVSLDSQLNEVQKINLSDANLNIVASAIGISSSKNFWIFNSLNQQLGFYNYTNSSYRTLGLPFSKTIKNYNSSFNNFYWIDEANNFYYMDIFGKTKLITNVPEYEMVFIGDEKTIVYLKNEIVYFLDLEKNKTYILEIAEKSFKNFFYKDQNLAIFTTEGITNYKINLP
jgi:hypothetical protein